MIEWISVEDRLPEMATEIIFWNSENHHVMSGVALPDGVHKGGSRYPCSHWMPLPDPPQSDQE